MFSFSWPLESVSEGRVRVSSDVRGWAGDNVTLECRVTGAGKSVMENFVKDQRCFILPCSRVVNRRRDW